MAKKKASAVTAELNGVAVKKTSQNALKVEPEKQLGAKPEQTKTQKSSATTALDKDTVEKKDKTPNEKVSEKKNKAKKNKSEKSKKLKKLDKKLYEAELEKLQRELVKLQYWVKAKGLKVVVLFEGRDAAGKGGAIKRISECLNPRICRVVALGTPTDKEKTQWYFQRYVAQLPAAGEIVLFDRSWYNRAGVERVMGFCTHQEYVEFLRSCPEFEHMLQRSGIVLIKYWFSVSDDEQEKRFQDRLNDPAKRWKLSPMDLEARARWVDYSRAKDDMFAATDTTRAPWNVVKADDKKRARLNCISHLLSQVDYEDLTPPPLKLPKRQKNKDYERPPLDMQNFIPNKY